MNENTITKGWARVLLIIIPYFFIVGLFQITGAYFTGHDIIYGLENETTHEHLIISFSGFLGTLMVVILFMKWVDKMPFISIGLYPKNHVKGFVIGLLAGLIVMTLGYLVLDSAGQLQFLQFQYNGNEIFLTMLLFLIVSLTEEILFRGYVLRCLMESMNKFAALLVSAILFALLHAANPNLSLVGNINLFLAGILLGLPYIYTKNLMFPIALHFSWNFFQSLFGFNVSGVDSYSLIVFETPKKTIFNGGDFGFEGSLLAIIFQILLIFLCYIFFNYRSRKDSKVYI
ncbi:CPBP family intramembrane glutamic endopeptidase [Flagellimonas sediminis]|uniref:CPBP family intramembrane metalloprotease n=1 Tax=Flagellimonas sediminis TaxID=2696468 RepID=A0A6I5KQ11_9FLAO|nr:type II CAAX endopeptidase family protein [Allomuricauda sediminis]NDV42846.1 CPBP family intramembrane metalloprotease [Allomuricauda sediminis]